MIVTALDKDRSIMKNGFRNHWGNLRRLDMLD